MKEEMEIKNKDSKGIVKYKATKKAVPIGTGAMVYVPKELSGEMIDVEYNREDK